jgi:hypothetical protein
VFSLMFFEHTETRNACPCALSGRIIRDVRARKVAVLRHAAARAELVERGVDDGEIRHKAPLATWRGGFEAGVDPERRGYASFAEFSDADGNAWTLPERGFRRS